MPFNIPPLRILTGSRRAARPLIVAALLLTVLLAVPVSHARPPARQTPPPVMAEALGPVNLRFGPGIDYFPVGQIEPGTRYPVVAQHSRVPWLQIDHPAIPGPAWVYVDLVTITGDLAQVPFVSDFPPYVTPTRTPSSPPTATPTAPPDATPAVDAADDPGRDSNQSNQLPPNASPTPDLTRLASPTPTLTGPVATTLGEANIRFGPDISYPTVLTAPAGSSFRVLQLHALVPWVRLAVPESPTGDGWVFREVIRIEGDVSGLPTTEVLQIEFPTLTPTPQTVMVGDAPWNGAPVPSGELAATLGAALHNTLLDAGFVPYSDQLASVFVLDLASGDSFTLFDNVAFSGMSLTKIPILVTYFLQQDRPLTYDEAFLVADTMMCSENITTNRLLEQIGDGDPLRGAQRVTAMMQQLNLQGTFIMRQYLLREGEPQIGVGTITTGADQTSARPDLYNQMLPQDLGWLLAGIYQCAQNETGLLMNRFPEAFDAQECRKMLYALDANAIGVFLEAGVPRGTRVIHKHGWVNDTHGDAGIVIGPEGAFVFVTALYGREWLEFEVSSPVIAELARQTWNTFNPNFALPTIDPQVVPLECDPANDPVLDYLLGGELPMPGP